MESSRCGDQVFWSRVTTSTLAGEYVTAREYEGGRASCENKTRDKGEAMVDDVRVVEEGAADYGTWGRYDPPKLWFPCSFFVFLFVLSGQGGRGSTRARGLAKLGQDPTAAPQREGDRVRGGGFLLLFRCFCIFL